jgi:regulator of replication initiation timing
LELKLNFLHRKRNQELDAVKEGKNDIIIKLKNKVSTVFSQNHLLRVENEELKLKCRTGRASHGMPHRKNNFIEESEEYFRLELSP